MRADGKSEGLRQSMSWLHTWSGLLLGWLLYAVFFTGTLSYFLDEVNLWMKPELHRSVPDAGTAARAVAAMQELAPRAAAWTIALPNERQAAVEVSWREPGAAAGRAGLRRAELDAGTGEVLQPRQTRGGAFLYRFHFELHAMPRLWARWIVGVATMLMFVAILSGVVTHKKIFADFFTFRPGKGQRSWLDAHNATAVLALPFHLMITFSGLLLLMYMLMPWGIQAGYQGDMQAYAAERRAAGMGGGGGGGAPPREAARTEREAAAPLAPVAPMLAEAGRRWPGRSVGTIVVNRPGTDRATVELREHGGRSLVDRGASRRLLFDGMTGELRDAPALPAPSAASATYNVLTSAHLGRFAGPALRWLLFLSGMAGTAMAATGLVLWVVKRLPERRKLGRTPFGHRLVEVLNVGAVAGLSLATAGYFWLNRLLPAGLAQRADWEVQGFFALWAASLLHAALRPHRRAWLEQMAAAAAGFALLPLLNPLTGGHGLFASVALGQWPIAGFDLAMLSLALLHGFVAWRLLARPAAPVPARGRLAGATPGARP
ncbi:PepSY-associated TM helix domain-containing protein [Pigmentiphaga soli]|uniref:PepSY-associated TM helix domain-containing protein n=1 Tax=Pigmentiphaga soli TaxID=1007095 RepID=A0ABP8GGI9_9BURK